MHFNFSDTTSGFPQQTLTPLLCNSVTCVYYFYVTQGTSYTLQDAGTRELQSQTLARVL